ncbi:MAG: hypothetical protein ACTSRY_06600, partial [Alphaproteobacteria bacterium]
MDQLDATTRKMERRHIRRGALLSALLHLLPVLLLIAGSFTLLRLVETPASTDPAPETASDAKPVPAPHPTPPAKPSNDRSEGGADRATRDGTITPA